MNSTFGESVALFSTVKIWVADVKRGRTSTAGAPRTGGPKTATSNECVLKYHKIVVNYCLLKLDEIAEAVDILKE